MSYTYNVVGIGSSAGGLAPLKIIFNQLPPDINAAIIIIPHLLANMPSNLGKILHTVTGMPIMKVEENTHLKKGVVYVLGEGLVMTIKDKQLQVRPREASEKINKAIDHFFISLAEEAANKSVGVVLSGAGYDGIEGAKAIEDKHGLVIVQEPYTAEFPLMPQALIANDHPDYILTPEDIAYKLGKHCR
ncbi:chemotaxis protein CheB [Chitinophaga agri]|uniref:protein-glutamate methylesterase n=1 Tax=Chitinophaga agri TaxID=2703787 RepID=A0A6B9ZBW8_9BACT|nr:chemotaxis protein CheB [Chitinophaga agri]QHS59657.1 chemotaxis protein CheB [Chitinophaga agri]